MNYTVNVISSGTYVFGTRVASRKPGGTFHVEVDGVNVTGSMSVPNTGGLQRWTDISTRVTLMAGIHTVRVVFEAVGQSGAIGNFNYFTFRPCAHNKNRILREEQQRSVCS